MAGPVLLAGAENTFDCENTLPAHQRIGAPESKRYTKLIAVTLVLGLFGGMAGYFVVGPAFAANEDGTMMNGKGLGKAMAKAFTADIEKTVDKMNNDELGKTFSNLQHDMCEPSVVPAVKEILGNPETKAQLDEMMADPRFPDEVRDIAIQSLAAGTLNPLKSLGKWSHVIVIDKATAPTMTLDIFRQLPAPVCLCLLASYGTSLSHATGPLADEAEDDYKTFKFKKMEK